MTDARRRHVIRTLGAGIAGAAAIGTGANRSRAQTSDVEASVTFEDQTSNGLEVTIARASSPVEAFVMIRNADGELLVSGPRERLNLDAGDVATDVTLRLDPLLSESQPLTAQLQESNGGRLDTDTAQITVTGEVPERASGFAPRFVEADPDAGFDYPYYLYAADAVLDGNPTPILVQPNNTGTATDDFSKHREAAADQIRRGFARDVADRLGVPLLVPVFPRPKSDPVDWSHYTHSLDRQTLQIDDGPLERIDLQLLRMAEDAQTRVETDAYAVADEIIMNGFSASGNFVDRFAVLHPNRVLSVTAGGLNGMALLPTAQAEGRTLNYQVGIADVEGLTGEPVDLDALDDVNQFLYMGSEDSNDTLPYTDAWTNDEIRETAKAVYGEDMIVDRFPLCQRIYEDVGVSAQFRVYDGVGHNPRPAFDDVVEFHRRSIEGESVEEFGRQLGLGARIELDRADPDRGESVEFDATDSRAPRGEILAYIWDFGDGDTEVGSTVSHPFPEERVYTVSLRVIDSFGREDTARVKVGVGDAVVQSTATATAAPSPSADDERERSTTTTGDPSPATAESADPPSTGADSTLGSVPGFGVETAIAGVGGGAYLLAELLRTSGDESE